MRILTMSILLLVGVIFDAAASDTQAEDKLVGGGLITDSCAAGGSGCDILAQAVLRRDFASQLSGALSERFGGLALCPVDNPQCCPPRLMPLCSTMVGSIVDLLGANLQLERALAGKEVPVISLMKLDLPDDFFRHPGRSSTGISRTALALRPRPYSVANPLPRMTWASGPSSPAAPSPGSGMGTVANWQSHRCRLCRGRASPGLTA